METIYTAKDLASEVQSFEGLPVRIEVQPDFLYFTKRYGELYTTPVAETSPLRKQEIQHRIERLIQQFNTRSKPHQQNAVKVLV